MFLDNSRELSVSEIVMRSIFRQVSQMGEVETIKVHNGGSRFGGAFVPQAVATFVPSVGKPFEIVHTMFIDGGQYPGERLRELRDERGVGSRRKQMRAPIASVDGLLANVKRAFSNAAR